jgi:hypothetical protein
MNKSQYVVLAKKTIRSEWQIIFAIDADERDAYEQATEAWKRYSGYKCIVLKSQYGSYITGKEVAK